MTPEEKQFQDDAVAVAEAIATIRETMKGFRPAMICEEIFRICCRVEFAKQRILIKV